MTDSINTWREKDGDNTYALDWPIRENSLVWEIGGYEGRWAAQMVEKFDPTLHIFEPQDWAFRKLTYFWCQFHTFADPDTRRSMEIYNGMQKTHNIIWDFYPTAVAWERRTK